jgi:hypothetical protein
MNYAGEGEATSMFENNSTGVCTDRTQVHFYWLYVHTSSEIRFI